MRKYLLLLIVPFLFLNNVYAECENLIPNDLYMYNTSRYDFWAFNSSFLSESIIQGDTYTIYFNNGNISLKQFLNDNNLIKSGYEPIIRVFADLSVTGANQCDLEKNYCSQIANFTGGTGVFQLQRIQANQTILNNLHSSFYFVHGDESCLPADEPEEPVIDTDNPVIGFYNIYLDKLGLLANYSLENKYLLSFIGIILVFILLELFLFLFKGGRRR